MKKEVTFAIIKPDALVHRFNIIDMAKKSQYAVKCIRIDTWPAATWERFYAEHADKPFFPALIMHMSSGPVTILVLEREQAIAGWREMIGATDPRNAAQGTIRRQFGTEPPFNAVHGSDSAFSAAREIAFFFSPADLAAASL